MPITSEIEPIVIRGLGELVAFVTDTRSDSGVRWFRGQRKACWDVLPSLWRDYSPDEERNFTNRFRTRSSLRRAVSPRENDYAGWLSLMQHYGLPTRLLDWTRSPLVAAYFAVRDYRSRETATEDAAIWVLDPHVMNLTFYKDDLTFPIDSNTAMEILEAAFKKRNERGRDVLAVMAVEHDMRMFVQQGAFTIHPAGDPLNTREGHARFLRPLLIPRECVRRMAEETFACGFRRGDMFPDLANLADEFRGLP
jgi:hypothetical protein